MQCMYVQILHCNGSFALSSVVNWIFCLFPSCWEIKQQFWIFTNISKGTLNNTNTEQCFSNSQLSLQSTPLRVWIKLNSKNKLYVLFELFYKQKGLRDRNVLFSLTVIADTAQLHSQKLTLQGRSSAVWNAFHNDFVQIDCLRNVSSHRMHTSFNYFHT